MNSLAKSHRSPLVATVITALVIAMAAMATLNAAQAQVSGEAFSGFRQNSSDPIQIEADELEVIDSQSKAIYRGNVKVRQGPSLITTSNLEVRYRRGGNGGQGDIDRLILTGGVVATSNNNKVSANSGTFFVRTEEIVLSGDVVISQGDNVAAGCELKANLKTNVANLSACNSGSTPGRVKTVFTPGSQPKR
ncbi:MAG: LptA/OstA family protein [Pseudomonadota bacterium]